VSTAPAADLTVPLIGGQYHFLLRRLHSLTGIIFGGYLLVHLLVNATIAQGKMSYQIQVNKIHDLPFLPVIEWTFIYLPIIYHTIYGIWITFTGRPNVSNYPYGKNVFYLLQRISAFIIVLFILFHVLSFKYGAFGINYAFDPLRALKTVAVHFEDQVLVWFVYPLGILASCFHLANGFWTAGITWGLTVSAAAQRRWGWVCVALFIFSFGAGMTALIAASNLDPAAAPAPIYSH
jgi:succinate dehydrogenase / fumarate reductase, cytochrome b subunit